jgi:hypothetical protein
LLRGERFGSGNEVRTDFPLRLVAAGSSHPSGGNQQTIKENQRIKKNQTCQEADQERDLAGSVLALGASLGLLGMERQGA